MIRGQYIWRIPLYYVLTHRRLFRIVHRLYEHNAAVAWVLRSLLLAEIALMISTAVIMQRSLEFSNACLIVRSPHIVMYFG
jgi:hypothetical protein